MKMHFVEIWWMTEMKAKITSYFAFKLPWLMN